MFPSSVTKVKCIVLQALTISENTIRRILTQHPQRYRKEGRGSVGARRKSRRTEKSIASIGFSRAGAELSVADSFGRSKGESLEEEDLRTQNSEEEEYNDSDNEEVDKLQQNFELWLVDSEECSVLEDEQVLTFLKTIRCVNLFFGMLVEPFEVDCSDEVTNNIKMFFSN